MLKNIFCGVMVMLIIAISPGCKKSCGFNCQHNGYCDGGTCHCPDPYSGNNCDTMCMLGEEGYMCQTLSRTRFIGTWSCTSKDQYGNTTSYLITFTTNGFPLFMNLNNFDQNGSYPIICTMTGKYKFDINQGQQDSLGNLAGLNGTGNLNNGTLTMNIYTNNNQFFATATMQ